MSEDANGSQSQSRPAPPAHQDTGNSESSATRRRDSSGAAGRGGRFRSASQRLIESNLPSGFSAAIGTVASKAPSFKDIRRGSYGSRKGSENSLPRLNNIDDQFSPMPSTHSPTMESPLRSPLSTEDERVPNTSSSKLRKVRSEEDDGFPAIIFGRGEMNNQSYVRGQRSSAASNGPTSNLAVRKKDLDENQEGQQSVLPTGAKSADDEFVDAPAGPSGSSEAVDRSKSTEPFPSYSGDEDEDDDLDDFYPKPKRNSKNLNAMLGGSPSQPVPTSMPAPIRGSSETHVPETPVKPEPNAEGVYPNGYSFPPPKSKGEATIIGLKAFMRFTFTWLGFFIVLYGLNVVAWGGMLFLLLCNASPAMCQLGNGIYDCNNIDSPRRVWVEVDSQILNALFCVTGFGLIPWRFRDFYYWIKWRVAKKEQGLRKLAGYHNSWFRLKDSDKLPLRNYQESQLWEDETNPALPIPLKKAPSSPLTGARAPPTAEWKMDYVIWAFVLNTFLQAVLSGFMWGLNRYDRPSWSTGLFVALACIVAAMGGLMQFLEGKKIKKVEGIPLETEQALEDVERQRGGEDKGKGVEMASMESPPNGSSKETGPTVKEKDKEGTSTPA